MNGKKILEVGTIKTKWIAIGYNVPATPSKNRVYIWRKIKECGAEYFKQGVAVLPNSEENIKVFGVLEAKIKSMGGEASLVEMSFLSDDDEQEMVDRFREQSRSEYQGIIARGRRFMEELAKGEEVASEAVKLEKELIKVQKRDHFGYGLTAELRSGLDTLLSTAFETAEDFKKQLRDTTGSRKKHDQNEF